jgi:hypothetical protein
MRRPSQRLWQVHSLKGQLLVNEIPGAPPAYTAQEAEDRYRAAASGTLAEFIEFYETITNWPRSERAAFEEHAAERYRELRIEFGLD